MEKIKPVVFKIGNGTFGVDISKVQAIELYSPIVPVPNAVAFVDGLINIRGEVIPVYNLRDRNRHRETPLILEEQQFILVECKGSRLAVMADSVEDIKDVRDESYHALPIICSNKENEYIIGITQIDDVLVIVIDVDKLLSDEEMEILNEVKK